jgi:hypothetical protein
VPAAFVAVAPVTDSFAAGAFAAAAFVAVAPVAAEAVISPNATATRAFVTVAPPARTEIAARTIPHRQSMPTSYLRRTVSNLYHPPMSILVPVLAENALWVVASATT